MCGIAGILRVDAAAPDGAALRGMTAALAHRGPDGDGFFEEGPVGRCRFHRVLATRARLPAGILAGFPTL